MKRSLPWLLAAFLVAALRLGTPVAKIMTDGAEYLNLAVQGFAPGARIAAPFAYRFAVPIIVHLAGALTGFSPRDLFPLVALLAGFGLLMAAYGLALQAGAARRNALIVMLITASSLFAVRFPLYCPFDVDIEACLVACAAFACYRRGSPGAGLAVSLVGLLFKEFLAAPLAALAAMWILEYIRERTLSPLRLLTLAVVLAAAVFIVPRVLIPVTSSFGTITEYRLTAPSRTLYFSQLRMFLAWPPKPGALLNIALALLSFWLPVAMLWTPSRGSALTRSAGNDRIPLLAWLVAVTGLMTVGGTKIMVFAVYTAPLFIPALAVLLETGPSVVEVVFVAAATALFNRIVLPLGSTGGDPGVDIGFYGAYGLEATDTTAWRFAEAAGWVAAAALVRAWWGRRRDAPARRGAIANPADLPGEQRRR